MALASVSEQLKTLQKGGFEPAQAAAILQALDQNATAHQEALKDWLRDVLVSKEDLALVRRDVAATESTLTMRMIQVGFTFATIVIGAVYFLLTFNKP